MGGKTAKFPPKKCSTKILFFFLLALPRGGPFIQGFDKDIPATTAIDDVVMVNCTSLKSKPAAHLQFEINGRPAARFEFFFKKT